MINDKVFYLLLMITASSMTGSEEFSENDLSMSGNLQREERINLQDSREELDTELVAYFNAIKKVDIPFVESFDYDLDQLN